MLETASLSNIAVCVNSTMSTYSLLPTPLIMPML